MAFKPKNERHAINEVVFVLYFLRVFTAEQLEAVASQHDRWKADLPRKQRNQMFRVSIVEGVGRDALPTANSGVMFLSNTVSGWGRELRWRCKSSLGVFAVNGGLPEKNSCTMQPKL